ncbi:MAG: hypothetical protein P8Z00_11080 [Anaerolineales bacterium]
MSWSLLEFDDAGAAQAPGARMQAAVLPVLRNHPHSLSQPARSC